LTGTAKVDSLTSTKAVRAPSIVINGVLLDSLKMIDGSKDTLYWGQGGKVWTFLPVGDK
jgi:hypothetical protein